MRLSISIFAAVSGSLLSLATASGQVTRPWQVWDVRFVADSTGAFAQGPGATAVGITLQARVGITPNTTGHGTANFGVARVGGAGSATSGFRIFLSDTLAEQQGVNQGRLERGVTSPTFTDTRGEPIDGHFSPFRGSFSPQVAPLFMGSNTDPGNGGILNPATGSPILYNLTGARGFNFGSDGTGPVGVGILDQSDHLVGGDYADVYRVIYFPDPAFPGGTRDVQLSARGSAGRYIFAVSGLVASVESSFPLADFQVTFQVPAPSLAPAAACTLALLAHRKRREPAS